MYNGDRTIVGKRTCKSACVNNKDDDDAYTHDRSVSIIHLHSPIEMRISCLYVSFVH